MAADDKRIHVFYGPDTFSAREALADLRRDLDTDGTLAHNTVRLDGRTLAPADLVSACQAASFFETCRLVIVEGLLSRLSGAGRRSRRGRRRADGAPGSEDDNPFVATLLALSPTTNVVLLDETASEDLLDALRPAAAVRQLPLKRKQELGPWIARRVKERGGSISPAAVARLAEMYDGAHLGELAQEVGKLTTYAGERTIEAPDVDALAVGALDHRWYEVTDAVIEGHGEKALRVLKDMNLDPGAAPLVLTVISGAYRQLLLAQDLLRESTSAADVGKRLGIPNEFVLRKVIEQATRYPATRMESAYRRILEADVAVKTGVLDGETAIDLLVAELAEMAANRRAGGGRGR